MVASDRISAFAGFLPTKILAKGRVLAQFSKFWLYFFGVLHHLVSTERDGIEIP
ncbi:hypothetical protein N9V88_03290 [bacterium]|nr:hypothetical protein [bacterium]|eukprot:COSAG01_NODE_4510_length_4965_cov_27.966913_2_plen_54_part_00